MTQKHRIHWKYSDSGSKQGSTDFQVEGGAVFSGGIKVLQCSWHLLETMHLINAYWYQEMNMNNSDTFIY